MPTIADKVLASAGTRFAGFDRALRSAPYRRSGHGPVTVYRFRDGSAVAEDGGCFGHCWEFKHYIKR